MVKPIQFKVPTRKQTLAPYDFPNGFSGGMNISVAPDQLIGNQSPDMSDCDYSGGGVPTKRYGLSRVFEVSLGATPIRHMVDFPRVGEDTEFLIIQGGKLLKVLSEV